MRTLTQSLRSFLMNGLKNYLEQDPKFPKDLEEEKLVELLLSEDMFTLLANICGSTTKRKPLRVLEAS